MKINWVKFWTHRQGGSMICDERVYYIDYMVDIEAMEEMYRKEINYDGRVHFEIKGFMGSDEYKVKK